MTRGPARLPTLRQALAKTHWRLIALAVLLSGSTLLFSGLMTIQAYFERNLVLAASTIGYAVEPAMVFGDTDAMRDGMRSAGLSDIRLVELRAPDQRVLARWPASGPEASAEPRLVERLLGIQPVSHPVDHAGEVIGEVRVYGDPSMLVRYIRAGALISFCCLLISAIALRIMARRMQEVVVTPLAEIAVVAHAVRQERAFARRVARSDIAEVDSFICDFNGLIGELENWHQAMTAEQERLAHEATHDSLTGLGNRALFNAELEQRAAQAMRDGTAFALFYLDVDHFKQVNDTHGHQSGDTLLVAIARRLSSCLGPADAAFRLGGDEFALLLAVSEPVAGPEAVIQRIDDCMAEPLELASGERVVPSVSIGAAIHSGGGMTLPDLIAHADADMYRDKLRKRSVRRVGE